MCYHVNIVNKEYGLESRVKKLIITSSKILRVSKHSINNRRREGSWGVLNDMFAVGVSGDPMTSSNTSTGLAAGVSLHWESPIPLTASLDGNISIFAIEWIYALTKKIVNAWDADNFIFILTYYQLKCLRTYILKWLCWFWIFYLFFW